MREYVSGGGAAGRIILRRDSEEASEIRYLQELLTWRNFSPGNVDGDFRDNTERAVKAFQSANGLDDDGVVGQQTWEALIP